LPKTTLVSANLGGGLSGNNDSYFSGVSSNGKFVLFQSRASDLVATPNGTGPTVCQDYASAPLRPCSDVFLRDVSNDHAHQHQHEWNSQWQRSKLCRGDHTERAVRSVRQPRQ
jgi:hypothetical protein